MDDLLDGIEQYVIDLVFKLRRERNLSQKDISVILGVKKSFIGNVENPKSIAKYNLKHINLLAHYFGISPQYFVPLRSTVKGEAHREQNLK